MKEHRSGSQILFGYLPEQTVDLGGRVWKVRDWNTPIPRSFDDETVRAALARAAQPWAAAGTDGGYLNDVVGGRDLSVVSLNYETGVDVIAYPSVGICKECSRMRERSVDKCRCGSLQFSQLHFVGYHECGALREPYLACPTHREAQLRFPGTASAREIRVICPRCDWRQDGLGFVRCSCGGGFVTWAVHRTAAVYTPRSVTLINPPNPTIMAALRAGGGPQQCVHWALSGLRSRRPLEGPPSRSVVVAQLIRSGLDESTAERMADVAVADGAVQDGQQDVPDLRPAAHDSIETEALDLALAVEDSRVTVADLKQGAPEDRLSLYDGEYPIALETAGLEAIEYLDRFPIMTAMFGYTRGDMEPGPSALRFFRTRQGALRLYCDISQAEALMVRLSPQRAANWLIERGHDLETASFENESGARQAIVGGGGDTTAIYEDLKLLVHSYAHRFIRRIATFSGIERASLGEFLIPWHTTFIVYGQARGDFVLGGLQAVFEMDLHLLLRDVVGGEHRCPLDPGCAQAGSACPACMHLGETACASYNLFLNRDVLFAPGGFLVSALAPRVVDQKVSLGR